MNKSGADLRASENQSKFIQERINKVEQHFGELCTNIAAFSRKLGKLRDKGDEVAKSVMTYAENESHNPTTQSALIQFASNFAAVQDYRDVEVRRMEDKVIGPLTEYGQACKHAKERLKSAFSARDKELKQKKNLDKVRDKAPSDRRQIAETELQKASVDASRTSRTLEEEIDCFEKKKLADIKTLLLHFVNIELLFHAKALEKYTMAYNNLSCMNEDEDLETTLLQFVNIELMFHAKALEMYTVCYQGLTAMNADGDLEEFRNSLRPHATTNRLEMQRSLSKTSLNTTMNTTQMSGKNTPSATRREDSRPPQPNDTLTSTQNTLSSTQQSSTLYSDSNGQLSDDDDDDVTDGEDDASV